MDLTNADVADILALLDSLPYDSLDVETSRFRLTLRRAPGGGWTEESQVLAEPAAVTPVPDGAAGPSPPASGTAEMPARQTGAASPGPAGPGKADAAGPPRAGGGDADGLAVVAAPLPGTFYRAPRPGADPFVQAGDEVAADTVVAIVETMKLMNSVHAGTAGRVARICVENGEFAPLGTTLLLIAGHVNGSRVLRRVLVANRGEIAVRVIRTCRRLGIETVLTVSDADAESLPARLADRVIRIGPAPASASYLNVDAVMGAAAAAGADAVHPGYGFLSENARLARACAAAGIVFIGPDPGVLEATGDKLAAREHAVAAGLPVLPGGTAASAMELDAPIGYPVLVKAAGGGGGRGLRVVRDPADLEHALAVASAEAAAAFGDPRVYLERYVEHGRHVEVQLLGDGEHVIHLGDRDCSVQRRYQKLIEEAPAPALDDGLRERLRAAAVSLGERLRYRGAGTVEFLVNAGPGSTGGASGSEFYFLEVNARIQVEHPVTEAVTGVDIVAEQLAIAEGGRCG